MCRLIACFVLLANTVCIFSSQAREPKEFDTDVNYKEERLPSYDLPPLLLTAEGKKITTADEWHQIRRPQIMALFSNF